MVGFPAGPGLSLTLLWALGIWYLFFLGGTCDGLNLAQESCTVGVPRSNPSGSRAEAVMLPMGSVVLGLPELCPLHTCEPGVICSLERRL